MNPVKTIPRIAQVSLRGSHNLNRDGLCQDAHLSKVIQITEGVIVVVVAVADGAATAEQSKHGAIVAVKSAVSTVTDAITHSNNLAYSEEDWSNLMKKALIRAAADLSEDAKAARRELHEYATTLTLLAVAPGIVASAQVGEGLVIIYDLQENLSAATVPPSISTFLANSENGAAPNKIDTQTTYLTSANASTVAQVYVARKQAQCAAVITSGLIEVLIERTQGELFAPNIQRLLRVVNPSNDLEAPQRELLNLLKSQQMNTAEDLTAVVLRTIDVRSSVS